MAAAMNPIETIPDAWPLATPQGLSTGARADTLVSRYVRAEDDHPDPSARDDMREGRTWNSWRP